MAIAEQDRSHRGEVLRYIVNGLFATAVHYGVLTFCLSVAGVPSAGAANIVAAVFGITCSFIGNRYFVFRRFGRSILQQALRFAPLYGGIALLHGAFLLVWTDILGFDYRPGFLLAMVIQVALSYVGNRKLVFQ